MIGKLKKLFTPDNNGFDPSKRKFIRTAGALAALTVAAINVPSILKIKEIEKQIESGRVVGQTFYISETVVIDIPNVVIDQCTFIAVAPMDHMVEIGPNAKNCHISNSNFHTKGLVGTGIKVHAQPAQYDMTDTLRSAIQAAGSGGHVDLSQGTYNLGQTLTLPSNFQLKG